MLVRKRSIGPTYVEGSRTAYGVTTASKALVNEAICEDVTGVSGGYPFSVSKFSSYGGIMNGPSGNLVADHCPVDLVRNDNMKGHLSTGSLGLRTDSAYATMAQARTNPSRPDVDIPVFIGELGDLPSLVKDAGTKVIKLLARQHLRTHFGTVPLVRDLLSMCNFVQLTELRMKELRALGDKGLGRTRVLDNLSLSESKSVTPQSVGTVLNGFQTRTTSVKVWVHVKWHPSPGFPRTDASLLSTCRRAVFGLTIDPSTAWELIPFSWLADWYGSMGDYLAAKRNIVPCYPSTPQVMRHTRTETKIRIPAPNAKPGFTVSDYGSVYETKSRLPTTISAFTAYVPFLSGRQLAVLGSLAVLKHGRYF